MIDEDHRLKQRTTYIYTTNSHWPVYTTSAALQNHKEEEIVHYVLQEYSWKERNVALLLQTGKPVHSTACVSIFFVLS